MIYMEMVAHRKLIDIQKPVFDTLSQEANRRRVSLKKYIEDLLEQEAVAIKRQQINLSPQLIRIIGSALPKDLTLSELQQDDRLRYILGK